MVSISWKPERTLWKVRGGEPGSRRQALGALRVCAREVLGNWRLALALWGFASVPGTSVSLCCVQTQEPFPVSQDMSPVL